MAKSSLFFIFAVYFGENTCKLPCFRNFEGLIFQTRLNAREKTSGGTVSQTHGSFGNRAAAHNVALPQASCVAALCNLLYHAPVHTCTAFQATTMIQSSEPQSPRAKISPRRFSSIILIDSASTIKFFNAHPPLPRIKSHPHTAV